jgi:putative SOS response-associated peptidase YedK
MRRWDWDKDGLRRKSDEDLRIAQTPITAMAFLTTEPNSIVAPIHPKAMPVLLRTEMEFDIWLNGSADEAKTLQRPLPDDALELAFTGDKADPTASG